MCTGSSDVSFDSSATRSRKRKIHIPNYDLNKKITSKIDFGISTLSQVYNFVQKSNEGCNQTKLNSKKMDLMVFCYQNCSDLL